MINATDNIIRNTIQSTRPVELQSLIHTLPCSRSTIYRALRKARAMGIVRIKRQPHAQGRPVIIEAVNG